jgi:trans-2,3-dihydro-3-hydroxyanthranilate isomerase
MASYEFVTVDVFTDRRFGGNPLAVFPAAAGLAASDMQALAREFNLSETTFVLPPEQAAHTARVRIFTPAGEIPFAGHPNVGTGYVLASRHVGGERLLFEEVAGLVEIRLQRGPTGVLSGAEIAAPQPLATGGEVDAALVARAVGLAAADLRCAVHPPLIAGVGAAFVMVELADLDALRRARPNLDGFADAGARHPDLDLGFSVHLYVRDPARPEHLRTRMFAPLLGVLEDPATGSANAALAALLTSLAPGAPGELAFEIEQGEEMGRPSRLHAVGRRDASGAVRASVAGGCVPVLRGWVDL